MLRSSSPSYANPFAIASLRLSDPEKQLATSTFLEIFELAVQTTDPREEAWAAGQLRKIYAELVEQRAELEGLAPELIPSYLDALQWAAEQDRPATAAAA